jgi:hypothetical protein
MWRRLEPLHARAHFKHAAAGCVRLPDIARKERIEELVSDLAQHLIIGVEARQLGAELLEGWVITR